MYTLLAILFSTLWASAFMAVKIGLRSSPPLFLMGFRFLVAGSLLLLFARLSGRKLPSTWRDWGHLAVLGLLNNGGYLGFAAIALRHLSGGMGAVLASTNPLMLALVAPLLLGERMGRVKIAGFLLAFASVVTVMYSRMGGDERLSSMLLMLVANALMVGGTILFKRWAPTYDLVVVNGVQLASASVALLLPSLLLEPVASVSWDLSFISAIAYLALGVSCGAMIIWFYLLRAGDASRASAFFFLNPVLGLFMGALILGEVLHAVDFVGSLGVGLGIYLVQRSA